MKVPLEVINESNLVEEQKLSPDYVRISAASAMALQMRSGRFAREFDFGGINLLLNYEEGCLSDCGYCGLARTRPGDYEEKSFIRVEWPLVNMEQLAIRMGEMKNKLTRLCISQVTHARSHADTLAITKMINRYVDTPLSILAAPPILNRARLQEYKDLGVDMIGIGLDAVSEEVFFQHRTDVPNGKLKWSNYWDIIYASRDIFGPWKVNIHTVVGLGETDRDLIDIFYHLYEREILPYLFSFNPEPDSRMGEWKRSPITRWRRIQLIKHLIEHHDLKREDIIINAAGAITGLRVTEKKIAAVVKNLDMGKPFKTDGCPSSGGDDGCSRPYGSYRPTDSYRDFPFLPNDDDIIQIRKELDLENLLIH